MPSLDNVETRRLPASAAERELVLQELSAILGDPRFRSSKRCSALLKYIVEKTLEGNAAELKERTLGVEVFGRPPDYDTNMDPVVRVSAGESRKRIAQHYQEADEKPEIQISLPVGSYVPNFKFRGAPQETKPDLTFPQAVLVRGGAEKKGIPSASDPVVLPSRPASPSRFMRYGISAFIGMLVLAGVHFFSAYKTVTANSSNMLWGPLLQQPDRVLIVFGSRPDLTLPDPPETSLEDHLAGPYDHVSTQSAIALGSIVGFLQKRNRTYEVKDHLMTTLPDLQGHPIVLIGGLNNRWTLDLTRQLRYRLTLDPIRRIEDSQNPQKLDWSVDYSKPYTAITSDYAILARYQDQTTRSMVIVAAGIGPWANEAAAECASSPSCLDRLTKTLPTGWETKNIELVLKTDVIELHPGQTSVVAASSW